MKTIFTLRLTLTAVLCLFLQFSKAEAISKTILIETAGTLPSLISESEKYQITDLRLTGSLNGTDIKYIREMAGADVEGNPTDGKLAALDMSEANIVEGGGHYYISQKANGWISGTSHFTMDNEIGKYMFFKCESLVDIILPNDAEAILRCAFVDCSGLENITISNNVTYIGEFAFIGCASLEKLIIPDSVTDMGTCPLSCPGLIELYLGKGVKEFSNGAELGITGCKSLETIIVSEENPYISALDGVIFNKDMTTLITYSPGRKSSSYTVPESVTKIQDGAFYHCTNLTSIIIHENVIDLGAEAFGNCPALAEIHTNNPIPLDAAEPYFFDGVNQKTCTLYVPIGSIDAYKNAPGWKDFENIVEEDIITSITPTDENNISIGSISGGIRINTTKITSISIYNISGQIVFESILSGTTDVQLNKGVYIVKTDNRSRKVIVR